MTYLRNEYGREIDLIELDKILLVMIEALYNIKKYQKQTALFHSMILNVNYGSRSILSRHRKSSLFKSLTILKHNLNTSKLYHIS